MIVPNKYHHFGFLPIQFSIFYFLKDSIQHLNALFGWEKKAREKNDQGKKGSKK
jgi:hypothetical protein